MTLLDILNLYLLDNADEDAGEGDVQKKIQPWRTMLPSEDSEVQEDYARKRQNAGQLVLVTSLIDKPANLGGNSMNWSTLHFLIHLATLRPDFLYSMFFEPTDVIFLDLK